MELSNDILLVVLSLCDDPTNWSMRLTCKFMQSLPRAYYVEDLTDSAAYHGHFLLLKAMIGNEFEFISCSLCTLAAKGGHLEILKWLRERECYWDQDTCSGAAEGGHLETLI